MHNIMTANASIKFAIIIATYKRKNGQSPSNLRRVFNYLNKQTFNNFKLFIIGDDYESESEFESICKEYSGEIYYKNYPGISYRQHVFKNPRNKWANGGIYARYLGILKAIEEGFKYYVHLDDDEIWQPNHLQEHYNTIVAFPDVDFTYTISKFCNIHLPRNTIGKNIKIGYNNLLAKPANMVHSTMCINLQTVGKELLKLYETRFNTINLIKNGLQEEIQLEAMDKCKIRMINNNPKYKTIFIPKVTCTKETNINIPE